MDKVRITVKRTANGKEVPLPRYMSAGAAGMDLYAAVEETVVLNPGDIKLVPTGLIISLPEGYEAQIRPRSGLALKHGITMVNSPGTIDADYRGQIGLIMTNLGPEPFEINKGDRVAQMVINRVVRAVLAEVDEMDDTTRDDGGFGSTGR